MDDSEVDSATALLPSLNGRKNQRIYTDGSKVGAAVAAAAMTGPTLLVNRLPNNSSIFSAEARGILLALSIIESAAHDEFLILTDSFSCLQSIENRKLDHPLILEIVVTVHQLIASGKRIIFIWLYLAARYVQVYLLIVFFAISSWLSANGLFVEVPLFVDSLPEGWNLPSLLVIVTQAANVGVLVWSLLRWLCQPNDIVVIYVLLLVAAVATALVGLFWDVTVAVNGIQHSIPLLTLTAVIALVDCSSGVVFLPFIARFRSANYVTGYYIGGSLGGIIPAVVGLIQGVGKEPNCSNSTHNSTVITSERPDPIFSPPLFSVGVFCSVLCGLIVVSLASFTGLISAKRCRLEMSIDSSRETEVLVTGHSDGAVQPDENLSTQTLPPQSSHFLKLLTMLFALGFLLFGFLPAVQSFSCLPYGRLIYTLTVRLSSISGPVACLVALFLSTCSFFKITLMMIVGVILCGYQIALACLSPHPLLQDYVIGKILVVLSSVILTGLFSYVRVIIAVRLRLSDGANGLFWCGLVSQIGACIGAVLAFILVNVLNLFTSQPDC